MSYLTRGPALAGIGSKAIGAGRRHEDFDQTTTGTEAA